MVTGTVSSTRLVTTGDVRVGTNLNCVGGLIDIGVTGVSRNAYLFSGGSGITELASYNNRPIVFSTGNTTLSERMRITEGGMIFADQPDAVLPIPPPKNPYSEQIEQTRQDLFREIEQHLNQTQERLVEERSQQQSLLNDLELGTLDEESIKRMQQLAGIDINGVTIKLNGVEIIDEGEAEQPVIHSKHNWINKIKSGYEKAKVYIRGSKMAKGTEQPVQTIQD